MTRVRAALSSAVSAAALAAVVALYAAPEVVLGAVPEVRRYVALLDPSTVLLGSVAVLLPSVALARVSDRLSAPTRTARGSTDSAAASQPDDLADRDYLGARLDDRLSVAADYDDRSESARSDAREAAVSELRETAARAYARATGSDLVRAERAVDAGEWSDDRRATGLLSDAEGASIPVHLWLIDLFLGRDSFQNSVEHAVSAIDALEEEGEGR